MDHLMRLLPDNSYLPPAWNDERKYSGLFSLLNPCSGIAGIYVQKKKKFIYIYILLLPSQLNMQLSITKSCEFNGPLLALREKRY